jgi:hypothetical protein
MKKNNLLWLLPVAMVFFSGCFWDEDENIWGCVKGSGDIVSYEMDLDYFDGIKLREAADVFITQGPVQEVIVEAQENIIDLLDDDVDNDIWDIHFRKCTRKYKKMKIFITMPDITYVSVSGSGDIVGENVFDIDDLTLKISGSGTMDFGLDADDIDAKISGSGDIFLEGIADDLDYRISGSGDIRTFGLKASTADISISGSGNIEVWAEDHLSVNISGSGDVYFVGNPEIDVKISGSGRIIDAN